MEEAYDTDEAGAAIEEMMANPEALKLLTSLFRKAATAIKEEKEAAIEIAHADQDVMGKQSAKLEATKAKLEAIREEYAGMCAENAGIRQENAAIREANAGLVERVAVLEAAMTLLYDHCLRQSDARKEIPQSVQSVTQAIAGAQSEAEKAATPSSSAASPPAPHASPASTRFPSVEETPSTAETLAREADHGLQSNLQRRRSKGWERVDEAMSQMGMVKVMSERPDPEQDARDDEEVANVFARARSARSRLSEPNEQDWSSFPSVEEQFGVAHGLAPSTAESLLRKADHGLQSSLQRKRSKGWERVDQMVAQMGILKVKMSDRAAEGEQKQDWWVGLFSSPP